MNKKKAVELLFMSILLAIGVMGSTTSCSSDNSDETANDIPENLKGTAGIEKFATKVDYSSADNWLALPESLTKAVDVFYLYPTAYAKTDSSEPAICDVDNTVMRSSARGLLATQASVFKESCNVFAPFYRQFDVASLAAFTDEVFEEHRKYSASKDPSDALDYYFEHYNDGRPFILAGHSQGSNISLHLLQNYFSEHPDYAEKMIAAYPIGYGFTGKDLKKIKCLTFAEEEADIKVIVSWNTEGPDNKNQHNAVVKEGEYCINPLNWSRGTEYAPITMNHGSLSADGQIVAGAADAQIDPKRGVVVVTSPEAQSYKMTNPALYEYFGTDSYHSADYTLFYVNICENVAKRIETYFKQYSSH